jgi:ABC-type lipoprotein export system ATPase subunit/GNAT superfamily N-acetyltransferase
MQLKKAFFVEPDNASGLIAEAFGIGAGWEKKILDIEIEMPLPQIVFITGESGCGKTTLLKELGTPTVIEIPEDKPLHRWCATDEESLKLLSAVGLNDASLFCLRFSALSDSQQARARLYAALAAGIKHLVVDELFSTLDREAAKALAYSFQKTLRREGISLIAASPHDDIVEYLRPDLLFRGTAFPSRWAAPQEWFNDNSAIVQSNPIVDNLTLTYREDKVAGRIVSTSGKSLGYSAGRIIDGKTLYRKSQLAELHYKGKYSGGVCAYLFAAFKGREIGVLVGAKTRHYAKDGGMSIARVVVHPSYRGCGVGKRLIEEFLKHHENCPVETTAAMARFNPVFERAGMHRVADSKIVPPSALRKEFPEVRDVDWQSKEFCEAFFSVGAHRRRLAKHASLLASMYDKGGMKSIYKTQHGSSMPADVAAAMTETAITDDVLVAARLFWRLRPHTMARYTRPARLQSGSINDDVETRELEPSVLGSDLTGWRVGKPLF